MTILHSKKSVSAVICNNHTENRDPNHINDRAKLRVHFVRSLKSTSYCIVTQSALNEILEY